MIQNPPLYHTTLAHGATLWTAIVGANAAAGDRWLHPTWCLHIPAHVIVQKGC